MGPSGGVTREAWTARLREHIGYGREARKMRVQKRNARWHASLGLRPLATSDCEVVCPICFDDLGQAPAVRTSCGHDFHTCCMKSWAASSTTCPLCRCHLGVDTPSVAGKASLDSRHF